MNKKMKEGRLFKIYKGERPKVLLLGNGIPRAFGGESWNELLKKISDKSYSFTITDDMPMPLKATLLSNNKLKSKLEELVDSKWGLSVKPKEKEFLQKLLALDFDYILTTNYSCEIECALLNMNEITRDHIKERRAHYSDGMQTKFLIKTCNYFDDRNLSVWHIHGDVYSSETIALDNKYYGKLIGKYQERINEKKGYANVCKSKESEEITSWIDAFLLGDLYILGFGMNFSETDLWWLLEYKSNSQDKIFGETVFLDKTPSKIEKGSPQWCKRELMKIWNVTIKDFDFTKNDFPAFYKKAYEYLKEEVGERSKK